MQRSGDGVAYSRDEIFPRQTNPGIRRGNSILWRDETRFSSKIIRLDACNGLAEEAAS